MSTRSLIGTSGTGYGTVINITNNDNNAEGTGGSSGGSLTDAFTATAPVVLTDTVFSLAIDSASLAIDGPTGKLKVAPSVTGAVTAATTTTATLTSRTTALESNVADIQADAAATRLNVTSANDNATTLSNQVTTNTADISTIQGKLVTDEAAIAANAATANTNATAITALQTGKQNAATNLTALSSTTPSLPFKLSLPSLDASTSVGVGTTAYETTGDGKGVIISANTSTLTLRPTKGSTTGQVQIDTAGNLAVPGTVAGVNLPTLQSTQTSQGTTLTAQGTAITAAQNAITTNTTEITAAKARLTTAETTITTHTTDITGLKTRLTTDETNITALQASTTSAVDGAILQYPVPGDNWTGQTSRTITNQGYGNGTWSIAFTSQVNAQFGAGTLLQGSPNTNGLSWASGAGTFNTTTGAPTNTTARVTINGTAYFGESVTVTLPSPKKISTLSIIQKFPPGLESPTTFLIYGNVAGVPTILFDQSTPITWAAAPSTQTFTMLSVGYVTTLTLLIRSVVTGGSGRGNACINFTAATLTSKQDTIDVSNTIFNGAPLFLTPSVSTMTVTDVVKGDSTSKIYPPTAFTSNSSTISGQPYGNGLYTSTGSSTASGFAAYAAFVPTLTSGSRWASAQNRYNTSTGVYAGAVTTTLADGTVLSGEYLELLFPSAKTVTSVNIFPSIVLAATPATFQILGITTTGKMVSIFNQTTAYGWQVGFMPNLAVTAGSYIGIRLVALTTGTSNASGTLELGMNFVATSPLVRMDTGLDVASLRINNAPFPSYIPKWVTLSVVLPSTQTTTNVTIAFTPFTGDPAVTTAIQDTLFGFSPWYLPNIVTSRAKEGSNTFTMGIMFKDPDAALVWRIPITVANTGLYGQTAVCYAFYL